MLRLLGMVRRRDTLQQWLPGLSVERLWWYLALASVLMLLGQEIARSSSFILAAQAASDFEGFDEVEEVEDDPELHIVVPPPVPQPRGLETDRGPPAPAVADQLEVQGEDAPGVSSRGAEAAEGGPIVDNKLRQEWWDEDEFEGFPVEEQAVPSHRQEEQVVKTDEVAGKERSRAQGRSIPKGPQYYLMEAAVLAFLTVFAITYYVGRKMNEDIALKWAALFAAKDSVFDKNFSLLGTGEGVDSPLLLKEGQNIFKFYASGRRYCQSLLATLDLQSRHDLIARMWYVLSPRKDELSIEVNMNDESMEPFVFAVTRRKHAKSLHKEARDLQLFGTVLPASAQRKDLADELAVISESRDVASDLLKDAIIDQLFGEKVFAKHGKYFVSLHFSDQCSGGQHRKVLHFKFIIPPVEQLTELTRVIAVVPYFIDVVGRFKLSKEAHRRAEDVRSKILREETESARHEALSKRRDERRKALEDLEVHLSPEALRKREEKQRARQLKKSMPRIKMTRGH